MRKRFVVFEGVDGAGKSVVSKRVADALGHGVLHLDSPLPAFRQIRDYVDQYSSPAGRFLFYLASNLDLSRLVGEKLPTHDVLCARYYFSTLVGYSVRSGINISELMTRIPVSHDDFRRPDLTILLYVNADEQERRIAKRNQGINSLTDALCLTSEDYAGRLSATYLDVAEKMQWMVIDTSYMTLDEVVSRCIDEIRMICGD